MSSAQTTIEAPAPRSPRLLAALVASGVVWCFYFATLAPSLSGGDSGELTSAAYSMGVCHPPGYPLWNMLAKAWMTILPVGEIAWRVNLFCATCTALAVFFLVYVAYELGLGTLGAVCAGLFTGLSQTFWAQATVTEKYPPALAAAALCIYFVLRYENTGKMKYFYASAATFGVTAVSHQTIVTFLPIMAALMLSRGGLALLKPQRLLTAAFLAALPLTLYLYVLMCARTNPPINWGTPDTFTRLYHHVMRHQYPSEFTKNLRSVGLFLLQMGSIIDIGLKEFTPLLWALVPAGLVGLWRFCGRRKFAFVVAVALVGTIGFILELSPAVEREAQTSIHVVLMYGWMAVAIILGAAVEYLRHLPPLARLGTKPRAVASWAVAVCLVAVLATVNFAAVNMRGNYLPYDYAKNILKTVVPNAVLFPGGDHNTFPLIYLTIVEHERPDVTIADKYGYIEKSVYRDMPGSYPEIPDHDQRLEILKWIIEHETRPLYFSEPPNLPGVRLRQEGLLFRLVKADEPIAPKNMWDQYSWRNIKDDEWLRPTSDYGSQMVMCDYCMMRAHYFLTLGDRKTGEKMLAKSAEYGHGVKEVLNNLGSMAAEKRLTALAERLFNEAIDVDPRYQTPWHNLDTVRSQAKREAASPEPFPGGGPVPDPMSLMPQGPPDPTRQLMPPGIPDPTGVVPE
jgi:4-amino-4-deoxy-L-arabinose transferase-like glycosyltransferase